MLTLPIQVGKRYVRRDGAVVEASRGALNGQNLLYVGSNESADDDYVYADNGRIHRGDWLHRFDLICDAPAEPTGIEALVCQDIAERQAKGVATYGCTVAENPLTRAQWRQHLYEELLDAVIYLKREMQDD